MKIKDLVEELRAMAAEPVNEADTADVIKTGDGEQTVTKVAVSMFGTPEVINAAVAYGANFLIVHEPLFYEHYDTEMPYAQCYAKKQLIEDAKLTVFRFHDYAHAMLPDLIYEGQIAFSGLSGRFEKGKYFAVNRFILDKPITTLELAKTLERNLGIEHLRIAGARNNCVQTISCCFGTPGHQVEEFDECDTVLTGEICEWAVGEYVRDAAQMGKQKSMIVMGHINSEKCGMQLLCDKLNQRHPDLEVRYFDCGDVYSYTDSAEQ